MKSVVVLDSSAFLKHPVFSNNKPIIYRYVNHKWMPDLTNNEDLPVNPHGTAVCGIIARQVSNDTQILNFDIYDSNPKELTKKVLSALKYVWEHVDCNIINMSMGIRTPNHELEEICQNIVLKGITIVAAFDNAGAISYPAAYSFVVGVDTSPRCTHSEDFVYVENSPINIRAKGGAQRLPWVNPLYTINQGNSFAAPYVTAYLQNLYVQGFTREDAMQFIKEKAKYVYSGSAYNRLPNIFPIINAALFPYNKEMHSLISFSNNLFFNIHCICDVKYSGHIGLTVSSLFDESISFTIQNVSDLDWQSVDTIIIGHTSELEGISSKPIKKDLLLECLKQKKNVFSFDSQYVDEFRPQFEQEGLYLYCPNDIDLPLPNHFGKLHLLRTPVLGIFGTTKHQGKFTLQLQLRHKLQSMGYNVGQLGTEPTSALFGMDIVYPFGYNGLNDGNLLHRVEEINWLMHQIDRKNPEIILVGSQSGIIPISYYNIGQIPLHQMAFLLGTRPDAVILCVNIDDSEEQIARTIVAMESISRCKVIALAIYPLAYSNGWGIIRGKKQKVTPEIIAHKKLVLLDRFKIPVGIIGEKEEETIFVSACIEFFGGSR